MVFAALLALAGDVMPVAMAVEVAAEDPSAPRAALPVNGCKRLTHEQARHVVCHFDVGRLPLRLWLTDEEGERFGTFARLREWLAARGQKLVFAMNAGMYTPRYNPAGLYIEEGALKKKINLRRGFGNFHLLPNGVFWIAAGRAGVMESHAFDKAFRAGRLRPRFATQSGPMLVINGRLHPKFRRDSTSRKIRNGVGVRANGRDVFFVLSESRVNFHAFARLFRDVLKTPDALFLDGTISRLFALGIREESNLIPFGPIVGLALPAKEGAMHKEGKK